MRIVASRDRDGGPPQFGELCGDDVRPLTSDIAELADLSGVPSDARPIRSRHDLEDGDRVVVSIESIGELRSAVSRAGIS